MFLLNKNSLPAYGMEDNLNTSYVSIKHCKSTQVGGTEANLNTSYVSIKHIHLRIRLGQYRFKYILCFY